MSYLLGSREKKGKTRMQFVSWVNHHVRPDKKLPPCKRCGDTVELFEKNSNVDMTIRVEEIPESTVVISPEDANKWELFHANRPRNWMKRCDYLLVGEVGGRNFAVFIELKKKVLDKDDGNNNRDGYVQLHWSQPLFHYLLSVFNIDNCSNLEKSDFIVRFWQIGEYPEGEHAKPHVYLGEDEDKCFIEEYKGIRIRNKVTPLISLRELIES